MLTRLLGKSGKSLGFLATVVANRNGEWIASVVNKLFLSCKSTQLVTYVVVAVVTLESVALS